MLSSVALLQLRRCTWCGVLAHSVSCPRCVDSPPHRAQVPRAIEVLEGYLGLFPDAEVDLTHVNILAELYLEHGAYDEVRKCGGVRAMRCRFWIAFGSGAVGALV